MLPHLAQVHHSLSMKFPQAWQLQPMGFSGSRDMVASSDMSDLIAFLELLSRIELGVAWVEPTFTFLGFETGGMEGREGRSVLQASQQR